MYKTLVMSCKLSAFYSTTASHQQKDFQTLGVYHFHVSNLSQPIIYLQLQTLAQNLHNPNLTSGTVADLIDKTSCTWKLDLLKALYPFPLCKDTLGIPLSKTGVVADQLMWKYSNSGDYNVKKAYQVLLQDTNLQSPANHLHFSPPPAEWKVKVPLKKCNCIWRLLHDSLPTFHTLKSRGITNVGLCPLCDSDDESATHLFLHCPFSRACWYEIGRAHV